MQAQDFLLDDEDDLLIQDGDLVVGDSDGQHVEDIFELEPGELKEYLLVGIGITKKINGLIDGQLRATANLQLIADGYTVNTLSITNDKIVLDVERKS